jgi:hypothetical protein
LEPPVVLVADALEARFDWACFFAAAAFVLRSSAA